MGLQLVPKSVTVNDFGWCNGRYFVTWPKSGHMGANYISGRR